MRADDEKTCTRRAALAMCTLACAEMGPWFAGAKAPGLNPVSARLVALDSASAEEPCFLDFIDPGAPLPPILCVRPGTPRRGALPG
jgi:hypothetical protein